MGPAFACDYIIKKYEGQIKKISKMNAFEYLSHRNGDDGNNEDKDENSISIKDEIEEKI